MIMKKKITYEELERRVQELEKIESKYNSSKEALQKSENLFKLLYEKAPLSYQSLDENGHFIVVNKTWLEVLGYAKEEVIGKSFADFLHPDWQEHFKENFPRFKSIGEILGVEFEMVKKNGDHILTSFSGKISRDEKGNFQQTRCIFHDITDQKKTEEELYQEHMMLARTEAVAHVGSWEWEIENDKVTWSEELFRIFGLEPMKEAPSFNEHQAFYVPEDRVRLIEAVEECLRNNVPYDLEVRIKRTDGQLRHCVVRGIPEQGSDGAVNRLYGSLHDITDRKRMEEAMRESENLISSLFRSAPVGIGSVLNRVLIKVNNRLCEMTGYDETELIGRSARMLYPSDEDFEFVGTEKYAQIAHHGTGMVEIRWQRKDGTIIDVLLSSSPVDLQDKSKGVTFTALDITERKHAEIALQESEERFRTIMENIDTIAVQGYGPDGTTQYWNGASERLYGYSQQEAIGRNLLDLIIPPEMKAAVAKEMSEMAESGQPIPSGELLLMHKDGSRVPVISHHTIVKVPGRALELFCLDVDMSALKEAEAEQEKLKNQLTQAQKMESIGRLAGGVAHDFNNMLSVILGHTEMILEELDSAAPLFADLQAVQQAAKHSATLTRQLLTFARKQPIAPKVIDLNETVEGMLKMLRRLVGEDIYLTWLPGKNLAPVKVDPSQIDQILVNLCVNSRDAIVDVGKITIETSVISFDEAYCAEHAGFVPGGYILLVVSDDGCGMDRETLDHIFEPFYTTKEQGKGTGLGLASVYGAVKQNNGFINVYSEPGHGTTFRIYLPIFTTKLAGVIEKGLTRQAEGGHETVLLVEDEPTILQMTTIMLEKLGYSVLVAGTPGEAVRVAQEHPGRIDLLLTDVVMPEMNGRDLAKNLLVIYPDIRRLFMSGYTANVIAHKGVLDEGVHFIQKPFSMKELGGKVREALES